MGNVYKIYILRNKINNKVYIGQTTKSYKKRWNGSYKTNTYLFNAINKYGKDKFYYETLALCYTQQDADHLETYFIEQFQSRNRKFGYNIALGGGAPMLGRKHTEIAKKKISKANKGKFVGEDNPMFGKPISRKLRLKRSERMKGTNNPMFGNSLFGADNSFFGKKHTDETKKQIQINNPSRKLEPETVIKIRELYATGNYTQKQLGKTFDIAHNTVSVIISNKIWKNIV